MYVQVGDEEAVECSNSYTLLPDEGMERLARCERTLQGDVTNVRRVRSRLIWDRSSRVHPEYRCDPDADEPFPSGNRWTCRLL